jgi:hypothetical protein
MGEYATYNEQEIKIGTCENMYYLRYSDIGKIRSRDGNVDVNDPKTVNQLRFRLPFPDEDHIKPGDYEPFRGALLCGYSDKKTIESPGTVQFHSKTGMLVNITCYHGEKLPENTKESRFFWNGKGPAYELTFLKFIDGECFGVYSCIDCNQSFRAPLKDLLPFMIRYEDQDLVKRLIEWYAPDYKKVP